MHACIHSVLTEQNLVLDSVLSMEITSKSRGIVIILRFLIKENQIKSGKNQGKIREFDC